MPVPKRNAEAANIASGERTFFVSSSVSGQRALLQSERCAKLFIDVLYSYRSQGKYRLHEFVVMPDHFHVLLTVGSELSIEKAVQFIKGGFSFRAGKELGFRPPVWSHGFSEVRVLSPESYVEHRRYIQENPVKKGLAQSAQDFPFSSAHAGFELDQVPQGLKP
jgi:REP-associated tyrosine transposase